MVLRVFLLHHVLPLRVRLAPMWEYIRPGDQSIVVDGHLLEASLIGVAWMVLGYTLGEPLVDDGLASLLVFDPRPDNLPFLGEVSNPSSPVG